MNKADKIKRRMAESMVRGRKNMENAKYGEFVIQTNEVQYFLALAVLMRSSFVDNEYKNWLFDRAELGTLIGLFRVCARLTPSMYALFMQLQQYKKDRNRLAHKMFLSKTRLTPAECEKAIALGQEILKKLYALAKISRRKKAGI